MCARRKPKCDHDRGKVASRACVVVAATMCLAGLDAAMAQIRLTPGNPQRGQEVAARACTSCHVIGRTAPGTTVRADVPSFAAIANNSDVTAEQLAGRIIVPHPAMPNVSLTVQEIRDVVVYILTLKRKD